RRLEIEAADLRTGQVHLDHVLDGRVAEGDSRCRTQIAVAVGNPNADVATGTGCQPTLAGAVADIDEMFFQIEDAHAVPSIRDGSQFSTARDAQLIVAILVRRILLRPLDELRCGSMSTERRMRSRVNSILDRSNAVGIGAHVGTGRVCEGVRAVRVSDARSSRPLIMPANRAELVEVEVDSERILLGRSPGIARLWEQVQRIAPADVSVLITGEP